VANAEQYDPARTDLADSFALDNDSGSADELQQRPQDQSLAADAVAGVLLEDSALLAGVLAAVELSVVFASEPSFLSPLSVGPFVLELFPDFL
jgi:hypothetical protein